MLSGCFSGVRNDQHAKFCSDKLNLVNENEIEDSLLDSTKRNSSYYGKEENLSSETKEFDGQALRVSQETPLSIKND
ncbi:hypothetical protein ACH5RR_037274 [Cinchona calisaya]|uniref:Uncharacterized protein n=1 Tax=Cinchona calisaya TaxID=153742 RepID=A0ABD2YAH0_9GENT